MYGLPHIALVQGGQQRLMIGCPPDKEAEIRPWSDTRHCTAQNTGTQWGGPATGTTPAPIESITIPDILNILNIPDTHPSTQLTSRYFNREPPPAQMGNNIIGTFRKHILSILYLSTFLGSYTPIQSTRLDINMIDIYLCRLIYP